MYKLYPAISWHATLDQAIAYAQEIAGYRELWEALIEAELLGLLSPN